MNLDVLADADAVNKTVTALKNKNYQVTVVNTGAQALEKIKTLIPRQVSVMNGTSTTLEQIGYLDYLKKGGHVWVDLHSEVAKENDPVKRTQKRRQAVLSDFYLGSVHALTQEGEWVIGSNTGSQLPHVVFTSPNLIFVIGTQKIVPDLAAAMKRLEEYVVPLEDKHMRSLYNIGTNLNKIVIFKGESQMGKRNIHLILVKQKLGF